MERYRITHTTENQIELYDAQDGIYLNPEAADDVFIIMKNELADRYDECGRYTIKMESVDPMGDVIAIIRIYDSDK